MLRCDPPSPSPGHTDWFPPGSPVGRSRARRTGHGLATGMSRNGDDKARTISLPLRGAAHTSSQPDLLARLPDKLVLSVLHILATHSKRDICNVARVSRRYHGLADGILYKRILFDTPEHHLTFGESLNRRPRRGSLIQDFKLEYPTSELKHLILKSGREKHHHSRNGVDGLSRTLSAMSNLETLDMAVPVELLPGIGNLFNGPFDLACLKSCTLLFQCEGNAYWDLCETIHIFAHPTLEHLILKRAKLDEKGFDLVERPHSTALRTLRMIECDINCDSLSDVLEFPEELKEFSMEYINEPDPELEETYDDFNEYMMALKDQQATLESVTINFPTIDGKKVIRLRDFEAMTVLRLNRDTQLFGKSGKKPRLHSVGLPPNLQTLELYNPFGDDETVIELFAMMIESIEVTARHFKTLIVPGGVNGVPERILEACKGRNFEMIIR